MRLLIVEDDPDGREMLAELFRIHEWEVTAVPSTELAMSALRAGGFEVIISDEDLEGRSGSSMLREASEQGLLQNVGALMYTAEPSGLDVPPGVRVLRKPLGLSKLLDEAKAAAVNETPVPISHERQLRNRGVELVLYVTDSVSSQRALANLERVLATTHPERLRIDVQHVAEASGAPVLAERRAGTEQCVDGALDSTSALAALIEKLDAQVPASSSPTLMGVADMPPSSRARR